MSLRKLLSLLPLLTVSALAAPVTFTNLAPIQVEAARAPTQGSGMDTWSTAAHLQSVPFASVRQQGLHGAQGDLSIRGGAFNTSGLLLQGVTLRNPQTEHFQGDLDLPADCFEPAKIATGIERLARTPGHAAGAVVLDLAPIETAGGITLGGGEAGQANLRMQQGMAAIPEVPALGLSFFLGMDHLDRTDRLPDNDLHRWSTGGRGQIQAGVGMVDLLVGTSQREFGARGFYGTSSSVPSDEQVRNTLALASYRRGDRDGHDFDGLSAAFNRIEDTYWYEGRTQGTASEHRSDVFTLHGERIRHLSDPLTLRLRGELTREQLRSRSLGDHQRVAGSLAALPSWTTGPWTLTAGGSVDLFENDKPGWLPALGIVCRHTPRHALFVQYSEAIRLPSYTEYNYNNPASLGDQGLERQQTRTAELGWQWAGDASRAEVTAFAEASKNSVDWLRLTPDDTRFQAVNIESLRRYGLAADWTLRLYRNLDVRLAGLTQILQTDTDYHASRYLLDAVRHEVKAEGLWQFAPGWRLCVWQNLQRMARNPMRNSSRNHWLMGSEVRWQPAAAGNLTLTVGVSNLLDDDFEPFVGQPEAERRFYASTGYRW
jgi:vitamin B12 transporter